MKSSNPLEKAFIALLEQHKRLIVKIVSSYFKTPANRNDLIQEIILHLWKAFPKYDPERTASTWVYRIALNVAISAFRKEQNRKKKLSHYQQTATFLAWEEAIIDEKLDRLYHLISQLNPLEKGIIILHLEGCKNAEIADIIGVSLSNVSTKIHRIKTKLIKHYKTTNPII